MKRAFAVCAFGLTVGLGACAAPDLATRQLSVSASAFNASALSDDFPQTDEVLIARYTVRDVRVTVPRDLRVSEANMYYPLADIVWRGEPRADRHEQVAAIFRDALVKGTRKMTKGPEVVVEVTVRRFHSLTEKTRYSVGGVHSIRYDLAVRDAATGAVIEGPRKVIADIEGAGGRRAVEEEAQGLTQRVVIVHNLAYGILRELSERREPVGDEKLERIDTDLRASLTSARVSSKDPTMLLPSSMTTTATDTTPRDATAQTPPARAGQNLLTGLAVVAMQDQGGPLVFSDRARTMIAQYAD